MIPARQKLGQVYAELDIMYPGRLTLNSLASPGRMSEGQRESMPALTEHRGNAMLFSPTAMGITGFNAFPSVIHFSISPATCQGQAAVAVAAFAVGRWL